MAVGLNRMSIIGNAVKDAELKHVGANNTPSVSITIAATEAIKNKKGEWEDKTEYIPVVFWGRLAEYVGKNLKKGRQVHIEGRFTTRKWQDKDGKDRYTSEIAGTKCDLLGSSNAQSTASSQQPSGAPAPKADNAHHEEEVPFPYMDGDEVPFG